MNINKENCQIRITISLLGSEETYAGGKIITAEEFFNNRGVPMFDVISKNVDNVKYRILNLLERQKKN